MEWRYYHEGLLRKRTRIWIDGYELSSTDWNVFSRLCICLMVLEIDMRYYCKQCGAWPLKAHRLCRKCYDAKRYQDNKEMRLAQQHEWHKRNPDYQKEYNKLQKLRRDNAILGISNRMYHLDRS